MGRHFDVEKLPVNQNGDFEPSFDELAAVHGPFSEVLPSRNWEDAAFLKYTLCSYTCTAFCNANVQ